MKKKYWFRLDNAAKIYPAISNFRRGSMFSLSAVLTENVDQHLLNQAVNVVLNRFPSFKVKLNRGFFWYYLEENKKDFYVEQEPPYFLKFINEKESNDYLFRVFYYNRKISLVVFHAICDGTGALDFLKAIIFEYLLLKGYKIKAQGELKTIYSPPTIEESRDKFLQVYDKNISKPEKEKNAFKTYGTPFSHEGMGIITGKVSVDQLKTLCKKYNVTVTTFLCALFMQTIYKTFIKDKKIKNKLIKILVPVNMRKFYKTETVRNFSLFCRPGFDYAKEITLEECISICDEQLKNGTSKENLDKSLNSNVKIEKNWALKLAPLFVKDLAMRFAYSIVGDNLHTANLSNLGVVTLPADVKKYVDDIIFILGTSYTCKNHMAVISYNDKINISFSREIVENHLEYEFFNHLTNFGIDVEVTSNYWESGV